jgi:hypothetical protein
MISKLNLDHGKFVAKLKESANVIIYFEKLKEKVKVK